MKRFLANLATVPLLLTCVAQADTFGSGADTFSIDFTSIGDAGNADDVHGAGFGGVDYNYRIGTYEITRGDIQKYINLTGASVTLDGGPYPDTVAAAGLSWNQAARFVNWLNTSSGYSEAYKFTTGGGNDNASLWQPGDIGYNPDNAYRNTNAYYFLPSEDEWYKAAFYDPSANGGAGGYYDYATGADIPPTSVASGTAAGTAVWAQFQPTDVTTAGGLSPYGTMGQNGNVWELGEGDHSPGNKLALGGGYDTPFSFFMAAGSRTGVDPTYQDSPTNGFRIASLEAVPEPSAMLLGALGWFGLLVKRKRA